jgi:hypothetical protein
LKNNLNIFALFFLTHINIYAILLLNKLIGADSMAIGERIRFIRNLRGMTLKMLGKSVGFEDNTADVRMAQYEKGTRTPKADLTAKIAETLDVAPEALAVPNIENYVGVMHTLFALEDLYGFRIDKLDGEVCIRLDKENGTEYLTMLEMFNDWQSNSEKYRKDEITKEEYDNWRYNYPRDTINKKMSRLRKKRAE